MASLFVLARNAVTFSNSASFPFYVLGGILVPVSLLPHWVRRSSSIVFLSWSADLLRAGAAARRRSTTSDSGSAWSALLGACGLGVGVWAMHVILRARARHRGAGNDMRNLTATARVAWYAIVSGANDYWAIFTLKSWIFGWCVRMISQVSFFALIGKLLRSDAADAVLPHRERGDDRGVMGATFAMNMTTSERGNGTLSLLLASPSRPVVVFASRGIYIMADGVFSSLLGLFILGPAFGLHFPFPRVLLVIPLHGARRRCPRTASARFSPA